jgi:predicted phage-related endonuclease
MLTASEMRRIITPSKLQFAADEKCRTHVYELLAQRITGYVEPQYVSADMLRGQEDELEARILYARHYAPVEQVGFITNDAWGFTLGYSPDGLVNNDGAIECKSRDQKYQISTIANAEVPQEYVLQLQTGLLVSERKWIDFISYSGGLPMVVMRVYPDEKVQAAIIAAAAAFEVQVAEKLDAYTKNLAVMRTIPTERRVELEIMV